jgi:hypothetical protein
MIHEGERDREQKSKLINELKEWKIQEDIRLAKRRKTLFLCAQCGLRICFEPKEGHNSAYMSYHYDDFYNYFKNDANFRPFENNYKNTENNWSNWCDYICLDCGIYIENGETGCEKCGKGSIVAGSELGGKPCPVCKTPLNEGITLQGFEAYLAKEREIKDEWYNIYRERYQVKKPILQNYTEKEIAENKRRDVLRELYCQDDTYILNNQHNALRFEFRDSFFSKTFHCILEWDDGIEGKLIFFQEFSTIWIEKSVEYNEVCRVIELLNKYDYFNRTFFVDDDNIGLDGYTFGLEVKLGNEYKELGIWGIEGGILYDVGMLLIKLAGKTFKELYEYAW